MKKTLILSVLALGMMFTSCGTGGASLKSEKDSVSYAIGQNFGEGAFNHDSTAFDINLVNAGFRDGFNKKGALTREEIQSIMENFEMKRQVRHQKAAAEKFTKDSTANIEASAKYIAEKEAEGFKKTASGLLYKITSAGTGANSELGDTVTVNYVLKNPNGDVLQSTEDRGAPFVFPNEDGKTVKGFTEAMTLLNKGAKATIVIPHELGYGIQGGGLIGPCQAITFELEMVSFSKPKKK